MARNFKYVGPHDAVVVDGIGVVEQGHQVTVESPEVSAGLEGQADWEHVPDKQRSQAAKKAAQTRADESQEG